MRIHHLTASFHYWAIKQRKYFIIKSILSLFHRFHLSKPVQLLDHYWVRSQQIAPSLLVPFTIFHDHMLLLSKFNYWITTETDWFKFSCHLITFRSIPSSNNYYFTLERSKELEAIQFINSHQQPNKENPVYFAWYYSAFNLFSTH